MRYYKLNIRTPEKPMDSPKHFGNSLRALRTQHKIRQRDLATASHLSQGGLSLIEQRATAPRRIRTCTKLLIGLRICGVEDLGDLTGIFDAAASGAL